MVSGEHGDALIAFAASLDKRGIPDEVLSRTEELFLDWLGSTIAGWRTHPVPLFADFARTQGPQGGSAQIIGAGTTSSPYFAALINGAASHVVEQDDLHNGSVFHPATVVFPAVLAAAQDRGASGQDMLVAAIAGYEAGTRVGEFLGRSHYRIFHTTATVGTIAAAVAVGRLLKLDAGRMRHAVGNAGTQAAGLWEFLRDAADSKQLHTAKAAADGLLSAYMAESGLTGAHDILGGAQGMAAAMASDSDPTRLDDQLGIRWATAETSFKFHASCRHTHPAADALLGLMARERLDHRDVVAIEAHVHQAAIDVLGRVMEPATVHQAKFSMGTMLGLIAVHGAAGLEEFQNLALTDPDVIRIRRITRMVLDHDIEASYPKQWRGKVIVSTSAGQTFENTIIEPRGDPGNTLTRAEIEQKVHRLASYGGWQPSDIEQLISSMRGFRNAPNCRL